MAAITAGKLCFVIDRFADALEVGKADQGVIRGLRILSKTILDGENKPDMAAVTAVGRAKKSIDQLVVHPGEGVGAPIASLRDIANALAKKELTAALDSVLEVLHSNVNVSSSAEPNSQRVASASKPNRKKKGAGTMNRDLIADYVKRLEAALGDDRKFSSLFDGLRSDQRISQQEAVAIASQFYGKTSAGTSRSKALARIRERHEKLMEFTKQPSTAGRSAA